MSEYALFDFVAAYFGMLILFPLLGRIAKSLHYDLHLSQVLWLTLPLSVLLHLLTGQFTPLTKYAIDPSGHYLLKMVLVVMLYMGMRKTAKT